MYCDNNSDGLSTQVTISLMLMRLFAAVANSQVSSVDASSVCQIIIIIIFIQVQVLTVHSVLLLHSFMISLSYYRCTQKQIQDSL